VNVFSLDDVEKGSRIELQPTTDRWRRGDKTGTVIRRQPKDGLALVRIDKSRRTIRVHWTNLYRVMT
jgi:hypothetical protein